VAGRVIQCILPGTCGHRHRLLPQQPTGSGGLIGFNYVLQGSASSILDMAVGADVQHSSNGGWDLHDVVATTQIFSPYAPPSHWARPAPASCRL
jgi:hypothetical protein